MRLGDVERQLGALGRTLEIAAEPVPERQTRGQQREILVGLVRRDDVEGKFAPCHCLVATTRAAENPPEPRHHAGGGMRVALALVELDRLLEEPACRVRVTGSRGHLARAVEKRRSLRRILGELRRVFEVAPGFGGRRERLGTLPGPHEHGLRLVLDLGCVFRVRGGLVGGKVVRCDHLDHFVLVGYERGAQVGGGSEMSGTALSLRERLVRDVAHEVLEEAVLAVLGRARVCLHAEHLLAGEGREQRLDLDIGACERGERVFREGLAEHRGVLEQPPLLRGQAVEPSRDERVQRLRHLERLHRPGHSVCRAFLNEEPAVEQHPHGLDRVQRDALGAREDAVANLRGKTRHEPRQELLHRLAARAAPGRAR